MADYRKLYFEHYGMSDPGPEFDIHHIDLNHDNNEIDNLIMLPQRVHHKYHMCVSYFGGVLDKTKLTFDAKINIQGNGYARSMLRKLSDVMDEIEEWRLIKANADMSIFMEGYNGRT